MAWFPFNPSHETRICACVCVCADMGETKTDGLVSLQTTSRRSTYLDKAKTGNSKMAL